MPLTIDNIETPAVIINDSVAQNNISRFQAHCDAEGLTLRPHIKTHKSLYFARAQIAAGARGITCQKISEAEVMADGGIDDILITYNILGEEKLGRLKALARRLQNLSVVADNPVVVSGLSGAFATEAQPLTVLVECDTGAARCGVQTPGDAVALAQVITDSAGLQFGGFMTYPAVNGQNDVKTFMQAAVTGLEGRGIACPEITSGGSPDMWQAQTGGIVTEYRIGTYIFNDRSLVARETCTWDDCAAHVLATVVSTPVPGRVIIDAGSKVLTSDLLGLDGHGHIVGHPEARIVGLSEEHGTIQAGPGDSFEIGERIRIVPNHVCVVSNLFDSVWLQSDDGNCTRLRIDARGMVV